MGGKTENKRVVSLKVYISMFFQSIFAHLYGSTGPCSCHADVGFGVGMAVGVTLKSLTIKFFM